MESSSSHQIKLIEDIVISPKDHLWFLSQHISPWSKTPTIDDDSTLDGRTPVQPVDTVGKFIHVYPIIYKVFIHLRCSLSHYLQGFSAGLALGFLRFTSSLAQKGRGEHEEYPVGRGRLEPVGVSWRHGLGEEISGKITPPPRKWWT